MSRIDNDLLSVQEARILVENAREAQKELAAFPQEKLDKIIGQMAKATSKYAKELAIMSHEETGYGKWQDKLVKNIFASDYIYQKIKDMKVIGIIGEDKANKTIDIGVPVGVIVALPPSTSPVSTTIYKALIAIKSGNAIVFSPHPKARKVITKVLDILIGAAEECGLPSGAIGCLSTLAVEGTVTMMSHQDTSLILITGVPKMVSAARTSGKPVIYSGPGNGPAFIERSANIKKAVADIIASRTFDNGIVSASEQSVVAEECIADEVKEELRRGGAYFMSPQESEQLSKLFYCADGSMNPEIVGRPAVELAKRIGASVPEETKILISEQKNVFASNPYAREKLCPVLAFYIEKDWMHACEKCIELLVNEGRGHTLVIHSQNENVIREFALKKPVSRILVNTPASLGGIGATTNLFPALTLGSGAAGGGITSDNVSPMNLINIRKVGYGVRQLEDITRGIKGGQTPETIYPSASHRSIDSIQDLHEFLNRLLKELA